MVARIAGETVYLWRAVDHEGEVLDLVVQRGRDKAAALRLMRKLLKKQGFTPTVIVMDKLRSYAAAFAELGLVAHHERGLRQNNGKCRTSRSADASERCSGSSRQDQLIGVDTLTHGSRPNEARLIDAADVVRPPPLSASCDPARGLALLALHLELP